MADWVYWVLLGIACLALLVGSFLLGITARARRNVRLGVSKNNPLYWTFFWKKL